MRAARARAARFAFRHPLVRRAVYDATPPPGGSRPTSARPRRWRRAATPAVRAYHVAQFARAATARRSRSCAGGGGRVAVLSGHGRELVRRRAPAAPGGRAVALVGPLALALASAGRLEESLARLHEALDAGPRRPRADPGLRPRREPPRPLRPGPSPPARRATRRARTPRLAFELAAAAMTASDTRAARVGGDDRAARARRCGGAPRRARDAVLVAAGTRVLSARSAPCGRGRRAPGADLLAPLRALDDDVVGAHPTVLLHVSRALMRLERVEDAAATLKRAVAIGRGTSSGEMLVWLLGRAGLDAVAAARPARRAGRGRGGRGVRPLQAAPNPLLLALSVRAAIHHDARRARPRPSAPPPTASR